MTKLALVACDGDVCSIVENDIVNGSSEVQKSSTLSEDIKTWVLDLWAMIAALRVSRRGGDERKGSESHRE